jgi:hypothetical protein
MVISFLPWARALFLFISAKREFGPKDPMWCDSVLRYRHSKEAWSARRLRIGAQKDLQRALNPQFDFVVG